MKDTEYKTNLILSGIFTLSIIIGFAAITLKGIPSFNELFKGFGADLPAVSKFVMNTYLYWNLISLVAFIGFIIIAVRKNKDGWKLIVFAGVLLLISVPFTGYAMYAPIFAMGKVI